MKPYQQVNHQSYLLNNYISNNLTTSNYMHMKLDLINKPRLEVLELNKNDKTRIGTFKFWKNLVQNCT
jgi:hypothetical protein